MDFEKTGYLTGDYKYFHIKDISDRVYDFHYHDFYKIIFFIKGDVTYNVEGKNYEIKSKDFILVGKNEIHRPMVSPETEYERIVVYLSDSFLSETLSDNMSLKDCFAKTSLEHTNVLHLGAKETSELSGILEKVEEYTDKDEYASDAYGKLYLTEFLLKLNENIEKSGISYTGRVVYNEKIVSVSEYINTHLNYDLSVEALSLKFGISRYYLMRQFKEFTGFTIHQYILDKRLNYAYKLSKEGMKIKDAAVNAGFSDYQMYLRARKNREKR